MAVDFVMIRAPAYRIPATTMVGGWPGEKVLRAEFEGLAAWSRTQVQVPVRHAQVKLLIDRG